MAFCSAACDSAAREGWHGSECLDGAGNPLEPEISGMSPETRVALRALRRAKREQQFGAKDLARSLSSPFATATTANSTAATPSAFGEPKASVTKGDDAKWAIRLGDLQEHYSGRSKRELDLLETEAAIAAVLASDSYSECCADRGKIKDAKKIRDNKLLGPFAAELVSDLFKVRA